MFEFNMTHRKFEAQPDTSYLVVNTVDGRLLGFLNTSENYPVFNGLAYEQVAISEDGDIAIFRMFNHRDVIVGEIAVMKSDVPVRQSMAVNRLNSSFREQNYYISTNYTERTTVGQPVDVEFIRQTDAEPRTEEERLMRNMRKRYASVVVVDYFTGDFVMHSSTRIVLFDLTHDGNTLQVIFPSKRGKYFIGLLNESRVVVLYGVPEGEKTPAPKFILEYVNKQLNPLMKDNLRFYQKQ